MKNKIVGIFVCMLLIGTAVPAVGVTHWTTIQRLLSFDDEAEDRFGNSVSHPSDTASREVCLNDDKRQNFWLMCGFLKKPANEPPVFGTPDPANGSTNLPVSGFNWSIEINDPEGDLLWWSVECDNGESFSADNQTNGTAGNYLSLLLYETTYKVWVNATDFMGNVTTYTRAWYTFRTEDYPLIFGAPTPANGSTNNPSSLSWSIPINKILGNDYSWSIQCSNGQATSGSSWSNGTYSLNLFGLWIGTTYTVWVNASFNNMSMPQTKERWYTFRIQGANTPPGFGTPTPANGSTNNPQSFTWGILINDSQGDAFSWSIQCSNGQTNSKIGASNGIKSLVLSGLASSATYTVWVNATDPDPPGSGQYTRRSYRFTTLGGNNPPVFFAPSPANGSAGNQQILPWNIPINDTEGDLFVWSIECSNGQITSGTNTTNGTKSLDLLGLANATTYKVWVNATDPTGSGNYTRAWYTFKVGAESIDTDIKGGFGISVVITNTGTVVATDLAWSIDVSGGWIILSGSHTEDIIGELAVGASETIKAKPRGIGRITITVQAADAVEEATGFLLGPLVLRVQEL